METPSILALRPGAKLSKADRDTLRKAGIIVVQCAPEDLVAIQSVTILPANEMLRLALQTITHTKMDSCSTDNNSRTLRADFGRRVIEAYLALGEAK